MTSAPSALAGTNGAPRYETGARGAMRARSAVPERFILAAQTACAVTAIAVLTLVPQSLWLARRPDAPLAERLLLLPALLFHVPSAFGLYQAFRGKLHPRDLVGMLTLGLVGFSVGRWGWLGLFSLRPWLMAIAACAATFPVLLAARLFSEDKGRRVVRAFHSFAWLLGVGIVYQWGNNISDALAQAVGTAILGLLLMNPFALRAFHRAAERIAIAVADGVPVWLYIWTFGLPGLYLAALLRVSLGAGHPVSDKVCQISYNLTLVTSIAGLALLLVRQRTTRPQQVRASVLAALSVLGYLLCRETGTLAVLALAAVGVMYLARGLGREIIALGFVISVAAVIAVNTARIPRERWLEMLGDPSVGWSETARAREAFTRSGLLGAAGAGSPSAVAPWAGRDYAIVGNVGVNGGKLGMLLTALAFAGIVFYASEATLRSHDRALRLLGASLVGVVLGQTCIAWAWIPHLLPFTGVPLLALGRGVWYLGTGFAAVAVTASISTCRREVVQQ